MILEILGCLVRKLQGLLRGLLRRLLCGCCAWRGRQGGLLPPSNYRIIESSNRRSLESSISRILDLSTPSISRIIDFSTPRFLDPSNHRFLGPSISRPLVSSISRPFFPLSLHAQFAANIQINSHTITRFLHKFHSVMHFAPYQHLSVNSTCIFPSPLPVFSLPFAGVFLPLRSCFPFRMLDYS